MKSRDEDGWDNWADGKTIVIPPPKPLQAEPIGDRWAALQDLASGRTSIQFSKENRVRLALAAGYFFSGPDIGKILKELDFAKIDGPEGKQIEILDSFIDSATSLKGLPAAAAGLSARLDELLEATKERKDELVRRRKQHAALKANYRGRPRDSRKLFYLGQVAEVYLSVGGKVFSGQSDTGLWSPFVRLSHALLVEMAAGRDTPTMSSLGHIAQQHIRSKDGALYHYRSPDLYRAWVEENSALIGQAVEGGANCPEDNFPLCPPCERRWLSGK